MQRCRAPAADAHAPTAWAASLRRGNATGTHGCPRALATLLEVECDLWHKRSGSVIDHCSPRLPCTVAGNHERWPARALLGSQLVRRIDAMKTAYRLGCAYAHTPLAAPVAWAEDHFGLGRSGDQAGGGCPRATSPFGAEWSAVDRARKYLRRGPSRQGEGSVPMGVPMGSLLPALRARLRRVGTPWYDGGGGGGRSSANELQVAVHLRRGDLSSHGLESDQSRWVPDEYYEQVLPRLVRALAGVAPVVVHVCSELPAGWSRTAGARWEAMPRAQYLPYIPPTSPLHLPYISSRWEAMLRAAGPISPYISLYLPYISPTSPLHLV